MNTPASGNKFVPKQAIAPTPQLYDELVADSMENLAKVSLTFVSPISEGALIHDNGCGTGAATSAIVSSIQGLSVSIKATDIYEEALAIYRKRAAAGHWPAETANMDVNALQFADNTFDISFDNALLFVLPDDGVGAAKEVYRTLKPGGTAIFNSWKYVPNVYPIQAASRGTRPAGTPLPRQGFEKWNDPEFLQSVVAKGGFKKDKIVMHASPVSVTTSSGLDHWANMLWSFVGGTSTVGWLKSDEDNWDAAIEIIKREIKKTEGFELLPSGRAKLGFVANIAIATK
ncbi:S-adenosyl-L-methionine-dependent methyltransferase [Xylariaceae sp. FL0594]|nr:S-adenosyl-L-methionine-dependent methyltransferase [Xylariaceae sp. FL0594]